MSELTPSPATFRGHEPYEANVRAVCITGVVLFGVVAISFWLIFVLLSWLGATYYDRPMPPLALPRANLNEPTPLQTLQERERTLVGTYEWVDRDAGIARIPVKRAMAILSENGLGDSGPASSTDKTSAPTGPN